jgi:phage terminase Nu1 subunit (DNA packaging protein)
MASSAGTDIDRLTGRVPAVVAEEFVDARRIAAAMGVSTTTIKRWTAAGAPSETWGMKRTRRFQLSQVIAWARAREADARPEPDWR